MNRLPAPDFRIEAALQGKGYRFVAGADEVGRGALAGPVVAAAVILPPDPDFPWLAEVRDSKKLTAVQRCRIASLIRKDALACATGVVASETIDAIGIASATSAAMRLALDQLRPRPQYVLIDYFVIPRLRIPHRGIIKGDESCLSIACASIIAKVARDTMMGDFDGEFPGYGFARHKGYGVPNHLASLVQLGPCRIHRTSFHPVGTSLGP